MKVIRTGALVALALCVYVMLAVLLCCLLIEDFYFDGMFNLMMALMAMITVAALFCIVYAFVTHKRSSLDPDLQKGLGTQIVAFKLILLPGAFLIGFLVVYGLAILLAFSLVLVFFFWTLPLIPAVFVAYGSVLIPFLLVVGVLLMLATSSFAISKILIYRKKYSLSTFATVVFVFMQLIPVADVISYPLLNRFYNSLDKETEVANQVK